MFATLPVMTAFDRDRRSAFHAVKSYRARTSLRSFAGLVGTLAVCGCGAGGDVEAVEPLNTRAEPPPPQLGTAGTNDNEQPPSVGGCEGFTCALEETPTELVAPPGCGDGELTDDEACDDGNQQSGDGCGEDCLIAEPGFSCAVPGQPCLGIARCGDGVVAATEQCDDANALPGDGCSERCRIELGMKCEGQPSVCTEAVCGNGIREGAEACDDGNATPFDGCSPLCLTEPNCQGLSCQSDCGDGLLIDEECDDGNLIDGDGCSSSCTVERGFTCEVEEVCEEVAGQCVLRVSAIFRDFSDDHPDFGDNESCTTLVPGVVAPRLDESGRPALAGVENRNAACMSTPDNFAQWYTDNPNNQTLVGELVLFENGAGGYVNRFGAEGEQFEAVDPTTERAGGASLATCEAACLNEAENAQGPYQDAGHLRCDDLCRPISDDRQQLIAGPLNQLNTQLEQAQNSQQPNPGQVAQIEAQIVAVEAEIAQLALDAASCEVDCQAQLDARLATCVPTCKPCSNDADQFCMGGELQSFDGDPLFFPVDSITGPTSNSVAATIPAQYGYITFPLESTVFPGAPNHNFFFTSEVQYWFKYEADTFASLDFLGDDDVWVFLNGILAVDLGGIHVPSRGSVTIDAASGSVSSSIQDGRVVAGVPAGVNQTSQRSTADFGLEVGNVYTISIFHAERQVNGSSFQLTLAGFEAAPSDCTAICGDQILSFGEECDDGVNDGGYNECAPGCRLGPFCGDGIAQSEFGEECDPGPGGDAECRGCRVLDIR